MTALHCATCGGPHATDACDRSSAPPAALPLNHLPLDDLPLGARFSARKLIGRSGLGRLYLVTPTSTDAPNGGDDPRATLRVLPREIGVTPSALADLPGEVVEELARARRLRHPHLAGLHELVGTPDGWVYAAFEPVEGWLVGEMMDTPGGMVPVVEIMRQTAAGLEAVHAAGLVHGALSPDSLMLHGGPPLVRLLDLGLARILDAVRPGWRHVLDQRYVSPEVQAGSQPSVASDVYSLGAITDALLAGRDPDATRPPVPSGVAAVLTIALAPAPAARFPSVISFANALTHATGAPPALTAAVARQTLAPTGPRARQLSLAIAAAVLGGVIVTGVLVRRAPPPTDGSADSTGVAARGDSADLAAELEAGTQGYRSEEPHAPPSRAIRPEARPPARPTPTLLPGQHLSPAGANAAVEPPAPSPANTSTDTAAATGVEPALPAPVEAPTPAESGPVAAATGDTSLIAGATAITGGPGADPVNDRTRDAARAARAAAQQAGVRVVQAVEARDLRALARALPGLTEAQREGWTQLFQVARDIHVELAADSIVVRGSVADARLRGNLAYWNRSLNATERVPVAFDATLVDAGAGWEIHNIRAPAAAIQ